MGGPSSLHDFIWSLLDRLTRAEIHQGHLLARTADLWAPGNCGAEDIVGDEASVCRTHLYTTIWY